MDNKELGLWCRRGLLACVYSGVFVWMNECLSGGNCSYIVRLSVRDLHGPTHTILEFLFTSTGIQLWAIRHNETWIRLCGMIRASFEIASDLLSLMSTVITVYFIASYGIFHCFMARASQMIFATIVFLTVLVTQYISWTKLSNLIMYVKAWVVL